MLQLLSLLCVLCVSPDMPLEGGETAWLTSTHPRITLKFGLAAAAECGVDCTRYWLIVNYRGDSPTSSEESQEWDSIRGSGCIDIVVPGKSVVACKQANSLVGTTSTGQNYAILRFRLKPDVAALLTAAAASVRLRDVSFRLSEQGRAQLAQFLQTAPAPSAD